jgi:two-component system, cell cycle response regulator DivK
VTAAHILVVEDDPLSALLVRELLQHDGYTVTGAANVGDACAALARTAPGLVLLDIQIPGGGGIKVLEAIRADPALRPLPVVAVTALAMAGDRERLLAAGFDAYVSKPIDRRRFLDLVRQLLRRGSR